MPAWHQLAGTLALLDKQGRPTQCRSDPDPFTSEDRTERAEAATACTWCPALAACRSFAEANRECAHVWGGTDRTPRPPGPRPASERNPR